MFRVSHQRTCVYFSRPIQQKKTTFAELCELTTSFSGMSRLPRDNNDALSTCKEGSDDPASQANARCQKQAVTIFLYTPPFRNLRRGKPADDSLPAHPCGSAAWFRDQSEVRAWPFALFGDEPATSDWWWGVTFCTMRCDVMALPLRVQQPICYRPPAQLSPAPDNATGRLEPR